MTQLFLLGFVFLLGCTSTQKTQERQNDFSPHSLMAGEKLPIATIEEIETEIYRTKPMKGQTETKLTSTASSTSQFNVQFSSIGARPLTKPYLMAIAENHVKNKAFVNNLDEKEKKREFNSQLAILLKAHFDKRVCFHVFAFSDLTNQVLAEKWKTLLIQGDKKVPLSVFRANVQTFGERIDVFSNQYMVRSVSLACANEKVDFSKPFTLQVNPDFRKDLLPVELKWEAHAPMKEPTRKNTPKSVGGVSGQS